MQRLSGKQAAGGRENASRAIVGGLEANSFVATKACLTYLPFLPQLAWQVEQCDVCDDAEGKEA
jgi:hypothetical protein